MSTSIERQAGKALEEYASAAVQGCDRRLAGLINTPKWTDVIKVEAFERPKTWRLVYNGADGGKEEMVFALQGSIVAKNLPPLSEKPRMNATKYKYLRQSVTVSGLETPTFAAALASTVEIFGYFDRQFCEGKLQSWSASDDLGDRRDLLEASNRYMTPRRDAKDGESIPFGEQVDPKNILKSMAGDDHVHTEDNEVLYFLRHTAVDGKIRHEKVGPQSFRVGDLVEIQISFVVVPLKGEQYKMMTVLRSIALIDGAYQQAKHSAKPAERAPTILKRKVRYDEPAEDDEEELRRSKKGMEVDEGSAI
ncbi:hypothetical protein Hypma_000107 [Hypsizygus marmoreus]|uniref:Uncharacterized protein n=1 Tax=Hypsizygus marmoreus TaxID=39966 RepID=A0A369KDQ2_HYPMA|nr:hypothetical protein Hypma_000107 [Hypsizygus marmoreus]